MKAEVIDAASSSGNRNMDANGTCSELLGKLDVLKLEIQEHVDAMDTMPFKCREELMKSEVKTALHVVAPKYQAIAALNLELEALMKAKTKGKAKTMAESKAVPA